MPSKRLVPPAALALFALGACTVTLFGDLEVNWTVADSRSAAVCNEYGIDSWQVTASGPDHMSRNYACGVWTTGNEFFGIKEGNYTVTVEALDSGGSTLKARSATIFVDSANILDQLPINFLDADFAEPVVDATINLYWNINGTIDGSDTGASWDTCAEVGAAKVVVSINGVDEEFDCTGGGAMSASVIVEQGTHTVSAFLVDSNNAALTTETATATITATATTPGTFIADFYWDSFVNPLRDSTLGDFLFTTSYEDGFSCSETSPMVVNQVTLLELDGTPVAPSPQVCGPDSACAAADGAAFGKCYTPEEVQEIRDVLWGEYQIRLQGTLNSTAGFEVCWETVGADNADVIDILIGAGQDNPVVDIDLARISTSGYCAL